MTRVYNRADQLQKEAQPELNDLQAKVDDVTAVNITIVQPAQDRCDSLEASVVNLESRVVEAKDKAATATVIVNQTTSHVNQILADIANIKQLDRTRINELMSELVVLKNEISKGQLATAVRQLKEAVNEQQLWIEQAKRRRENLSNQILNLKNLKEQIRP